MQRWVERTEARWGLCAGIAGAVATAALGAGLGFVFLPLVAAAPMRSLWEVMGENRKGEPVLALAARHPNATESVKRRAPR